MTLGSTSEGARLHIVDRQRALRGPNVTLVQAGRSGAFALVGLILLLPWIGQGDVLNPTALRVLGVAAAGAIGAAVVHYRRSSCHGVRQVVAEPWVAIALGLVIVAGTVQQWRSGGTPLLDVAVAGTGHVVLGAGLCGLLRQRLRNRAADAVALAGLIGVLSGLLLWVSSEPARAGGPGAVVIGGAGVSLLVAAARLLWSAGPRPFVYRAIVAATVSVTAADVVATFEHVRAGAVASLMGAALVLWVAAALDPSMYDIADLPTADPPSFSTVYLFVVEIALLAAPVMTVVSARSRVAIGVAPAVAVSVASVVIALYFGLLLWRRAATERAAVHDALTGLPDRTLFADRLARALAHARRNGLCVAVMFLDLDRFKKINDSFGHAAGDALLCRVASRLQQSVREEDTVARLSGDEFAVLLPAINSAEGAVVVAHRILASFVEPVVIAEQTVRVTTSIGVAVYPNDGHTTEALIEAADAAMYQAKEHGRNTFEMFSLALQTEAQHRLELEAALNEAIASDQLELYYQPRVDMRTQTICGAEALVRWNHPEKGLLFPGHFVPLAEQSGQILALGEWVVAAACEQLASWNQPPFAALHLSVNVSTRQLAHNLADFVMRALRLSGVDPRRLELELTESAVIDDLERTVGELTELRQIGVRTSIDDFGTGYSGLSYLTQLPLDGIKIDKSFLHTPATNGASIVPAIIAIGHSLGLRVTAEGVETIDQLQQLAQQQCDEMQGYLFSAPVPAAQFEQLVRNQRTANAPVAADAPVPIAASAPQGVLRPF